MEVVSCVLFMPAWTLHLLEWIFDLFVCYLFINFIMFYWIALTQRSHQRWMLCFRALNIPQDRRCFIICCNSGWWTFIPFCCVYVLCYLRPLVIWLLQWTLFWHLLFYVNESAALSNSFIACIYMKSKCVKIFILRRLSVLLLSNIVIV